MATITEEVTRPGDDIDHLALRISLADDDEQFEKIVQKSLVFILKYLAKYEDHRKKLMELLGDVTRRLKCGSNIQIPVHELFLSYNDPSDSVFLTNFSHMYIRLGYPRLPIMHKIKLLPILFASLSEDKPICQRDGLLHLTLPVIEHVTTELAPRDLCFNELPFQRRFISDFYSLVMLLPYNFQKLLRFDGTDSVIPDGFNAYDLGRVLHYRFSCINSAEELEKFKAGIMTFYSRHFFPSEESIIPVLFGYCDSRHSVVSVAGKELRNLSMLIDWEDEVLLSRLLAWYLGRRREFDPRGRNEPRRLLSPNMRIKIGHFLMCSRITLPGPLAPSLVEAAILALEPHTNVQTVSGQNLNACQSSQQSNSLLLQMTPDGVGGPDAATQPGVQGSYSGRTAAEDVPANVQRGTNSIMQQRRLAEHGLDLLAHLINNVTSLSGPASITALRCLINFVYERTADELNHVRARGFEILSRFLARDPNYLLKDPAQLPRLFDVLSEDNPTEVKLAAAHCLRRLAITFQEAQRQNYPALKAQLTKLEALLYENIEKPDPLSRLVAVNFAGLIYPSDHIPTRYLILQALGDKDPRVRGEAYMAFEQFLDPNIIHDIVYGRVKLPSFVEFVNHDTQHSRKNPFVEVERLIPVVQFIRLCLLATRGGLTPAQEAGLTYETEDEVRYLINQTVRYFLSAGNSPDNSQVASVPCATGAAASVTSPGTANSNMCLTVNPEQAKRSIDTYFRLIQVVIFTRSQHTKDSPDFPNYLEEVLVGNTKELITCNKQLFDRMNNVLLATPRGASCRHACASVYSVVVMETEKPAQALQTAKNMLTFLPQAGTHIDGESSHAVQGMFMGAAYLLERLFTHHVAIGPNNPSTQPSTNESQTSTKKGKKEKQQQQNALLQQQKQLCVDIVQAIEELVTLMDPFLIKPHHLFENVKTSNAKSNHSSSTADGGFYVNAAVAQATVTALLEALMVIARAGCLNHLPAGSFPPSSTSLMSSKASLISRISAYLPTQSTVCLSNEECAAASAMQQRVSLAALRALSALCMGEGTERVRDSSTSGSGTKKNADIRANYHPHTIPILKSMVDTAEIVDPSLHLAVGTALADCLLGPASPYKYHWYERTYPLSVPASDLNAAISGPAGVWLSQELTNLLTRRPGQVQARPGTLAASLWALNLVRRLGPPPSSLLSHQLLIDLLEEKDESVQCVVVATLGLIYDRSSEDDRTDLVANLTKAVNGDDKKQGSVIYRELCALAQQIGRPDLALSLIVLAIALPPNARMNNAASSTTNSSFANVAVNLASSVTYAGLVRRLGRALAPALPRLVPRVFVRRFDYARPKLRQAMENVWLGLVLYATNSVTPSVPCTATSTNTTTSTACGNLSTGGSNTVGQNSHGGQFQTALAPNSVHALASEMIEAHFNAIVCEIKTQLGFNTLNAYQTTQSTSLSSQTPSSIAGSSPNNQTPSVTKRSPPSNNVGTGTQNTRLRDACCLAIVGLTTHPSADKRLAGHLPALLSGLLNLCDEYTSSAETPMRTTTPAEEAAVAVQKLVIRVLENPCSREAATGLLPGLLPVIIDRAPWTVGTASDPVSTKPAHAAQTPTESKRLALELLLAAARTARPSALRPALHQLVLAGLQTMSSVHPTDVASLIRQPLQHVHITAQASGLPIPQTGSNGQAISIGVTSDHHPSIAASKKSTGYKEAPMAEVLRLCIRLIDDVCLSRLIVPFTELIRAGGGSSAASVGASSATGGSRGTGARGAASVAIATCVFLNHLAAANANALSVPQKCNACARCSSSNAHFAAMNGCVSNGNAGESPARKTYNSPSGSSQSSPSSLYGLSSPNTLDSLAQENIPLPNGINSTTTGPVNTETAHRCRTTAHSQKHGSGTQFNPNCTITTGGPSSGRGFASLAPHTGKLLAALLSALPGACRHPDCVGKTLQVEMSRVLACLLRFAKDTSVTKLFNRVRSWYLYPEVATTGSEGGTDSESGISTSHWACARVLHAAAHHCPDLLYSHAGITLPLIFLNKQNGSDPMKTTYPKLEHFISSSTSPLSDSDTTHHPILFRETFGVEPSKFAHTRNPTKSSNDKVENSTSEAYEQLWHETWEELIARIPTTPCSAQSILFWPTSVSLNLKSILPLANGLVNSFLRMPLLDHCTQLLYDALLDSPSWTVRTQASFALLQLAARMIGQPFSSVSTTVNSSRRRRQRCHAQLGNRPNKHSTVSQEQNPDGVTNTSEDNQDNECKTETSGVQPTDEGNDPENQAVENETTDEQEFDEISNQDEEEEDDDDDEVNEYEECAIHAWLILVQLTATALSKTKPWPGKVLLLRTTRVLSQYALEQRDIGAEPANQKIIEHMWSALVRETRPKRAEQIGSGYQAEAFLTLASFAEAIGRDAIAKSSPNSAIDDTADEQLSPDDQELDHLSVLFRHIVPQWTKRDKYSTLPKMDINSKLKDPELALAIRTVGVMWPLAQNNEYLNRFTETMAFLNLVLSQASKNLQIAGFSSVLGVLAKLTCDQSTQLVESVGKSGAKPFVELGFKDLLVRVKRGAENPKSQILREYALSTLATLIRHPSFLTISREHIRQVLQVFSNDGVQTLRDWSAQLLKSL